MDRSRRSLLLIGLGLAAIAAGWQVFGVRRRIAMQFVPIEGAPGWRRAMGGQVSAAQGAENWFLLGLEREPDVAQIPAEQLEEVLFGQTPIKADPLPMAVFSDFFCPYCRGLIPRIAARAQRADIAVHWHELPLLSPASEVAARAAVAADMQGGYAAFQEQLLKASFRPTPQAMARAAEAAGLDGNKLARDMDGGAVQDTLGRSRAAAERLGIFATPAIIFGRTVVMGEVGPETLDALIADEKARLAASRSD